MENHQRPVHRRSALICLIAVATLLSGISSSEARKRSPVSPPTEFNVGGLTNHTVHLPCNLPHSELPNIQWFDEVYNTGEESLLIFSSVPDSEDGSVQVGTDMVVDLKHVNRHNFHIGSDYSLTISRLNIDLGPGKYFCRSTLDDGTVNQLTYQLTVVDLPQCSGQTQLKSGESMSLSCHLAFSGLTRPTVEWYRTVTDEHRHGHHGHTDNSSSTQHRARPELIHSDDESDIFETPVAIKIVRSKTHAVDDGATYQCRVSIGNFKKECDMKLSVQYLAQNLKIVPETDEAFVGDVIKCSAQGNPTPTVDLDPSSPSGATGPGWRSMVISEELANKDLNVRCTASNSLNGTSEQLTISRTLRISKHTTPSQQPPVVTHLSGHHTQHHQHEQEPHHSHPPKKEDEEILRVVQADPQPAQVQNTRNKAADSSVRTSLLSFATAASLIAIKCLAAL